jgi:hypothetical protein
MLTAQRPEQTSERDFTFIPGPAFFGRQEHLLVVDFHRNQYLLAPPFMRIYTGQAAVVTGLGSFF